VSFSTKVCKANTPEEDITCKRQAEDKESHYFTSTVIGVNVDTLRRARSKQEFTPVALSSRKLLVYGRFRIPSKWPPDCLQTRSQSGAGASMNRRLSRILFFAFVVAAACSYLVYRIAGRQMNGGARPHTVRVMVAARDLPLGTVIHDGDISLGEWVGAPPKGVLVTKESVIGRGVVSNLYQGEPVLDSRLASAGSGGGLAATIRPGMRACAVKVDQVVGVAGFVLPGMRVDVLVSGTTPGANSNDGPKVKTVLQNIEVLSAGSNIQKDNDGKPVQVPVVNLLVTPEQAEVLSLASNQTRIQLVLRNPLDTNTTKTPGIAMASLFSDGAPPAPKPRPAVMRKPLTVPVAAPPRVFLVEILNGSKRSEEKFGSGDHQ
jgi:pilus assembly protein CpaB